MTVRDRVLAWLQGDAPTITHRVIPALCFLVCVAIFIACFAWAER